MDNFQILPQSRNDFVWLNSVVYEEIKVFTLLINYDDYALRFIISQIKKSISCLFMY